jgi:uncharacterized protein with von Willebrand factor type A (vWA) domain
VLNRFSRDYKVVFVGDASMSPWEIVYPGGSVEHNNQEAGQVWMQRLRDCYHRVAWINPVPESHWEYTQSIGLVRQLVDDRMYPLTVRGLEEAMSWLGK